MFMTLNLSIVTQNPKLRTELFSQVFYSLSIVILFENSLEKGTRLLLFLIHISI